MAHWNNGSYKENGPQYIIENAYYSKRLVFERTMEVIRLGKGGGTLISNLNASAFSCIFMHQDFRLAMFR